MMPMDPLYGLRGAIEKSNQERRLDISEAVDCYSRKSRSISVPGSRYDTDLQTEGYADLSIYSNNLEVVLMTIIKGTLAYENKVKT